jgi:hypothetical protein
MVEPGPTLALTRIEVSRLGPRTGPSPPRPNRHFEEVAVTRVVWSLVLITAFAAARPLADVWDTAVDTDDNTGSDNVPIHGTVQVHDLGVRPGPVADVDFYSIEAPPRTSWEAVIDGLTGDTGGSLSFSWLAADGTTVLANGNSLGGPSCTLCTQSARLVNNAATPLLPFIRVGSPGCGTTCNTADQYTFRLFETTISVPRFNNAGSQVTILLVQNTSTVSITVNTHFWNAAGGLIGTSTSAIPGRGLLALNTATVAAGQSGSITISNNGRFGDLSAKSVALEPATGFSFDTPGSYKPL